MDSYYPSDDTDSDEAAPSEAGTDGTSPSGDDEEKDTDEKMDGPTALIPKTLLAGKDFKPGEEVVMKIVHDHGDEVEIAYATGEEKGGEEDGDGDEMKGAMGKLNSVSRY